MGFELHRTGVEDQLHVNGACWKAALRGAREYGWRPRGTGKPEEWPESQPWPGTYDSCDQQIVTAADAAALADALERAIVSGEGYREWRDLASFCRGGAFVIW
jgi:hypothetical protein